MARHRLVAVVVAAVDRDRVLIGHAAVADEPAEVVSELLIPFHWQVNRLARPRRPCRRQGPGRDPRIRGGAGRILQRAHHTVVGRQVLGMHPAPAGRPDPVPGRAAQPRAVGEPQLDDFVGAGDQEAGRDRRLNPVSGSRLGRYVVGVDGKALAIRRPCNQVTDPDKSLVRDNALIRGEARITCGNSAGFRAGMPVINCPVILNARIGAFPGRLGHLTEQFFGVDLRHRLAGLAGGQVKGLAILDRAHELIGDPDRVVGVLVLDAGDVLAAEVHVEAAVAQDADLVLLARLGLDELLDIGVVHVEHDHLRGAPGGAARLDRSRRGIGAPHERDRPAGRPARGQQFLARADPGQVDAGAGAAFEDQALFPVPLKDRVHRVVDRQDEAVVHPHVSREVLAALGLDVVDLHLAEPFDPGDLDQVTVRPADIGVHMEQGVAGAEEARDSELADNKVLSPPDEVIRSDVQGVTGRGVQPQHLLDAVGLGRDDPRRAVGIVDLGPDRIVLDELADRNQSGRGTDQGVVWLAGGDLLRRGCPDVEPDRRVKAEDLVNEGIRELVLEDFGVLAGGEVTVLAPGCHVDAYHPVDELPQAVLTFRPAQRAAEVLGGHDVGRVDRPEVGELHAALLEVDGPVPPVGHDDITALPGDLVIRMDARASMDTAHGESLAATPAALPRWPARRLGHVLPLQGSAWIRCGPAGPCPVDLPRCPVLPGRSPLFLLRRAAPRPGGEQVRTWPVLLSRLLPVRISRAPPFLMPGPQGGDLFLKVSERLEPPADGGKPQVRDLVKLAKRPENRQAYLM